MLSTYTSVTYKGSLFMCGPSGAALLFSLSERNLIKLNMAEPNPIFSIPSVITAIMTIATAQTNHHPVTI
jgi:hypothetical protein